MPKKNTIRSCVPCQACCVVLRIESKPGFSTCFDTGEDIAKKANEPCRYLNDNGCGIYDQRPIVCRQFRCDWLQGRNGFSPNIHPVKAGYFSVDHERFPLPTIVCARQEVGKITVPKKY
jgi:hypothetical protein